LIIVIKSIIIKSIIKCKLSAPHYHVGATGVYDLVHCHRKVQNGKKGKNESNGRMKKARGKQYKFCDGDVLRTLLLVTTINGGILLVLVLSNQITNILVSLLELHLVHALSLVPM